MPWRHQKIIHFWDFSGGVQLTTEEGVPLLNSEGVTCRVVMCFDFDKVLLNRFQDYRKIIIIAEESDAFFKMNFCSQDMLRRIWSSASKICVFPILPYLTSVWYWVSQQLTKRKNFSDFRNKLLMNAV